MTEGEFMSDKVLDATKHVSLADVLDRVLGKGAVIAGDVTIAVADVDLVRLELHLTLGSSDTMTELPVLGPLFGAPR
jgi:hypothetical protein